MAGDTVVWANPDDLSSSVRQAKTLGLSLALGGTRDGKQRALEELSSGLDVRELIVMDADELDLTPIGRMDWLRKLTLQGKPTPFDVSRLTQLRLFMCAWSARATLPPIDGPLAELALTGFAPRDRSLSTLPCWQHLESLVLVRPRIDTLKGISRLSRLRELHVSGARNLEAIGDLAACPALEEVMFTNTPATSDFASLGASSSIRSLACVNCGTIPTVAFVSTMSSLERVVLRRTTVGDGNRAPLSHLRHVDVDEKRR